MIGAGVVGLAVARALARDGRETLALEAAHCAGSGESSRNSEVIHAGLYYEPGSLKARLCREGRERLYEFCARHAIGHRRCGKLLVAASSAQLAALREIRALASANAVELEELDRADALAREPALECSAALLSPLTGIVDSHAYMLALLGEAEARGASFVYDSRVHHMAIDADGVAIAVDGGEPQLHASIVINCAGVRAPAVARSIAGFPDSAVPREYFAKGSYFSVAGRAPFTHLIYPVPEPGGLGIHLTLDLAGRARLGPDVEWVDECDYRVDPARAPRFYAAARRYWPALPDGALQPAYAGVRAKLAGPGAPASDFRIDGPELHQAPIVNLFGIESPGLTASLAIAEHVADIVRRM